MSTLTNPILATAGTVALAASFIMVGIARPTITPGTERLRVATLATPAPRPVAPILIARHPSPDCPQMDNPGGRIAWKPSKDPGPVPTNGSVVIPSLGVRAPIVRVGFDSANLMVVPHNARDVGWLDQGGIPGKTNNVVLAGHINYSGVAGSFSRIGQLRDGNHIVVQIDEAPLVYRVEWTCFFDQDTDRAEQIMGYTNEPSLTLISCGGYFDRAARTHNKRVAVRAVRIGP